MPNIFPELDLFDEVVNWVYDRTAWRLNALIACIQNSECFKSIVYIYVTSIISSISTHTIMLYVHPSPFINITLECASNVLLRSSACCVTCTCVRVINKDDQIKSNVMWNIFHCICWTNKCKKHKGLLEWCGIYMLSKISQLPKC